MFGLRTWADWRAWLHVVLPGVAGALATSGLMTDNAAQLWVALAMSLLDPALSAANTEGARRALYTVMAAANAVIIGFFGLWSDAAAQPWMALIPLMIGGGVAAANTPTTLDAAATRGGRHARRVATPSSE